MGELSSIGFSPGRSAMHHLDPRTKQALLMVLSMVSVQGTPIYLGTLSVVTVLLIRSAGLRLGRLLREIRYFLFFLLFIFGIRAITFGAGWIPSVTGDAATDGLLVCWRLLIVVMMGILLMATTRITDIRAALVWYLKPVPVVDEKMAATMVGLIVRFLPVILFQAAEIADAQRARGIDRRRNPLLRLMKFTTPLFRRVFFSADELTAAMQARCYSDQRTLPELAFTWRDLLALGSGILISLTALVA